MDARKIDPGWNYRIVEADSASHLVKQVHKLKMDSWRPQGGVSVANKRFYQAMVQR